MRKYLIFLLLFSFYYTKGQQQVDSNYHTTKWNLFVSTGIGNYGFDIVNRIRECNKLYGCNPKYLTVGNLTYQNPSYIYKIYQRLDIISIAFHKYGKKFFMRSGFSFAFTEISTVGIGNFQIGWSGVRKSKKLYSNFYFGVNFMNKEKRFFSSPTFNFNTLLLGYDVGYKFDKSSGLEIRVNLLMSPHLEEIPDGHFSSTVVNLGPDLYLSLNYWIVINRKIKRK